jgi:hypothetical protein
MSEEAIEVSPVTERADAVPGRNTQMCVVEIDCRVALQPIPGGNLARQGVYRYRMYQGWLPVVLGQVRTERDRSEYERCQALCETEVKAFIAEHTVGLAGTELALRTQECRDTYPGSPEGFFTRDNKKSLPPFERVTLIEENLAAPADEAALQRAKETAALAVQVVREMQLQHVANQLTVAAVQPQPQQQSPNQPPNQPKK